MARFTNIGMPKRRFVESAAEEKSAPITDANPDAGPSTAAQEMSSSGAPAKKRKRRGTRGKVPLPEGSEPAPSVPARSGRPPRPEGGGGGGGGASQGWGRDPRLAKRAKMSTELAELRRVKRADERNSQVTCFACRSLGHAARDCPNVLLALEKQEGSATLLGDAAGGEGAGEEGTTEGKGMKRKKGKKGGDVVGGKCYRCNSTSHSLGNCPEALDPTNPTPFATCYVCLSTGHLSSLCPSNTKGVYVNGGSCKVCGSTAHRAKDCPEEAKQEKEARARSGEVFLGRHSNLGADEDDFMVESRESIRAGKYQEGGRKNKRHAPANNGQRGPKAAYEDGGRGIASAIAEQPVSEGPGVQAPAPVVRSAAGGGAKTTKSKPKVVAF